MFENQLAEVVRSKAGGLHVVLLQSEDMYGLAEINFWPQKRLDCVYVLGVEQWWI